MTEPPVFPLHPAQYAALEEIMGAKRIVQLANLRGMGLFDGGDYPDWMNVPRCGSTASNQPSKPIPLHNRVLPTQRDLCRLWQLSCGEGRYA